MATIKFKFQKLNVHKTPLPFFYWKLNCLLLFWPLVRWELLRLLACAFQRKLFPACESCISSPLFLSHVNQASFLSSLKLYYGWLLLTFKNQIQKTFPGHHGHLSNVSAPNYRPSLPSSPSSNT